MTPEGERRINPLSLVRDSKAATALAALTEERRAWLDWKPFIEIKALWPDLPELETSSLHFEGSAVVIGEELPEDHPDRVGIQAAAEAIRPWKKGPFRLFGIDIDAEWRSDLKWERLGDACPDLENRTVLDVGCNNGYYLFRMLPQKPAFLLGIDPVPRLWYQFHLLQRYARIPNLAFELWGWQELVHFEQAFDTIFCMGILYHHADPIGLLRNLNQALKPGGCLVLESIVIPGEDPQCLFPPDRYAAMRNVWFVPTVASLHHMLGRTGFQNIRTAAINRHGSEEQRTTYWNPGPSFESFIHPDRPDLTVEGHPAPCRAILTAQKK